MALTACKVRTTGTALRVTASVFAAALVLAACSSGGGGGGGGSASSGASKASGTRVTVTETEYGLKLSRSSFTPGTYTFVADNKGKITHALSVDGPGVEDAKTKNIQGGQEANLTVTLKKGTYDLYCPIPGHKQLGMNKNIQVG
ncbi:plastocyanin/azurin family copper-binding protein [Streptomyces sp. TLI_185]|uniref:plastocyanin/azurin family copper-binding protein n=1 Tax=Streptomyces sp. TLI_185 TaxID=2485151 RepID=UPI000F50C09E|nr:plastocyanin/azurin family copper-binding protein [Streptomyces sp. TLI_185]